MSNSGLSILPLNTTEPLWEWDVTSDRMYLSQGLIDLLQLTNVPMKMADYYKYVSHDDIVSLIVTRKNIIASQSNFVCECDYICNNINVHEHIIPLLRDDTGKATHILGRVSISAFSARDTELKNFNMGMYETGVWVFHLPTRRVWRDKICAAMLGEEDYKYSGIGQEEYIKNVHPADRKALMHHYMLVSSHSALGDNISDIVHIRRPNGEYAPALVRASVVERNKEGNAVLISGIMTYNNFYAFHNSCVNEDKLLYAINSMSSGRWNWDIKNDVIYACPQYQAVLGYEPRDSFVLSKVWNSLIHPDDFPKVLRIREAIISSPAGGDTFECTYRMRSANGSWAWIFDRGCVIWRDGDGRAGQLVGSIINITTAQDERDKLEELVSYDALTGLRSRAFYNLEMEYISQKNLRPVAILSLDVTGLKMINDSMGHLGGDKLLIQAASILLGALRASDCIVRKGGDEFLVILPDCDTNTGKMLQQKVEKAFVEYNSQADVMPIFMPCGMAATSDSTESIWDVVERADQQMYEKKKEQRETSYAIIKHWIRAQGKEVIEDDRLG